MFPLSCESDNESDENRSHTTTDSDSDVKAHKKKKKKKEKKCTVKRILKERDAVRLVAIDGGSVRKAVLVPEHIDEDSRYLYPHKYVSLVKRVGLRGAIREWQADFTAAQQDLSPTGKEIQSHVVRMMKLYLTVAGSTHKKEREQALQKLGLSISGLTLLQDTIPLGREAVVKQNGVPKKQLTNGYFIIEKLDTRMKVEKEEKPAAATKPSGYKAPVTAPPTGGYPPRYVKPNNGTSKKSFNKQQRRWDRDP